MLDLLDHPGMAQPRVSEEQVQPASNGGAEIVADLMADNEEEDALDEAIVGHE